MCNASMYIKFLVFSSDAFGSFLFDRFIRGLTSNFMFCCLPNHIPILTYLLLYFSEAERIIQKLEEKGKIEQILV